MSSKAYNREVRRAHRSLIALGVYTLRSEAAREAQSRANATGIPSVLWMVEDGTFRVTTYCPEEATPIPGAEFQDFYQAEQRAIPQRVCNESECGP